MVEEIGNFFQAGLSGRNIGNAERKNWLTGQRELKRDGKSEARNGERAQDSKREG